MSEVTEYLTAYSEQLAEKIEQNFQPLHVKGKRDLKLPKMKRSLISGQYDAVAGAVKAMQEGRSTVYINGELGTGKTTCSIAAVHTHAQGRPYRAIVMCPPHLVEKWKREVQTILPTARPRIIQRYSELTTLARFRCKPVAEEYWIVSESMAKLGAKWRPAVLKDRSDPEILKCPGCCETLMEYDADGSEIGFTPIEDLEKRRTKCPYCGELLWQWTHEYDRWPIATYIHKKMKGLFDYAILDEIHQCFPAEVAVATASGDVPIRNVQAGDYVRSFDGKQLVWAKVTRKWVNQRQDPFVKVTLSNGQSVVSTEGHHFYANGRWIAAKDLKPGDELYGENEQVPAKSNVQALPRDVRGDVREREESFLFSRVLLAKHDCEKSSCMRDVRDGISTASKGQEHSVLLLGMPSCMDADRRVPQAPVAPQAEENDRRRTPGALRKYETQESQPRVSGDAATAGAAVERQAISRGQGREWKAGAEGAGDARREVGYGMRSSCDDGNQELEMARDRRGGPGSQDCDRGRWSKPQYKAAKGPGSPERFDLQVARVDRDPSQKIRCRSESGLDSHDGVPSAICVHSVEYLDRNDDVVYDLEVEGTHCYFAGGVLVHNCQGDDTLAAISASKLACSVPRVITLTGTFLNGYAHSIQHLLFRLEPKSLQAMGFQYGETKRFAERYGRLERTLKVKVAESNKTGRGSRARGSVKVRPGIMPTLFGDHLLENSVFLKLTDIADDLPPISRTVQPVAMDEEQAAAYRQLESAMAQAVQIAMETKDHRLIMRIVVALMGYPDHPHGWGPIGYETEDGKWVHIVTPKELDRDMIRPKERQMMDFVRSEVSQGRKCAIFCEMTDKRDVQPRVQELLKRVGVTSAILRSGKVPTTKREEWIEKWMPKVDALIVNPRCCETGLDLFRKSNSMFGGYTYNVPTLFWYQIPTKTSTFRQASGRSWRLGQEMSCKVVSTYYESTMQSRLAQLMAQKIQASEAMDGRFSEDGLAALSEAGGSLGIELAKQLLESLKGRFSIAG
ncbi:MAG: polymorphic toxin-type HINT domain-containing protein [bacterium]|nr:polymorphic toxin-type HINT domain-containing protein [bacterium]